MHIHDVDLINYLFGIPESVHSVMTESKVKLESIFTQYKTADGMVITSSADWSMPQKFPFEERMIVNFEKACVKISERGIAVYTDEEVIEVAISEDKSHMLEMKEFISCITENRKSDIISAENVKESIRIALAEKESALTGTTVAL